MLDAKKYEWFLDFFRDGPNKSYLRSGIVELLNKEGTKEYYTFNMIKAFLDELQKGDGFLLTNEILIGFLLSHLNWINEIIDEILPLNHDSKSIAEAREIKEILNILIVGLNDKFYINGEYNKSVTYDLIFTIDDY